MPTHWDENALIGTGGLTPGLHVVTRDWGAIQLLAAFSAGHSVYAIDRDATSVVLGTKGGKLARLECSREESLSEEISDPVSSWRTPAVLAVCIAANNTVVTADCTGRCCAHVADSSREATLFCSRQRVICSLVSVSSEVVAGLTTEGHIVLWEGDTGRITAWHEGPSPPRHTALVNLMHLPTRGTLVYPSSSGEIVEYDLAHSKFRRVPAHNGVWYASTPVVNGVMTVGMHDRCLRIWDEELRARTAPVECPTGVQSVACTDEVGASVIMIDRDGVARGYELYEGELRKVTELPLGNCRVAVGLDPNLIRARRMAAERSRAIAVSQEIVEAAKTRNADVDSLHEELATSGYGHVSAALLAQQANIEGLTLQELRHRTHLKRLMGTPDGGTSRSLERYATLLEQVWRLSTAAAVLQELVSIQPCHHSSVRLQVISDHLKAMGSGACIIDAEPSLSDLIQAANILGEAFSGKWVVKRFSPMCCSQTTTSPNEIGTRYLQVVAAEKLVGSLSTQVRDMFLSSSRVLEPFINVEIMQQNAAIPRLEISCRLVHDGVQSVVEPILVFNSGGGAVNWSHHNRQALRLATGYRHDVATASWVGLALKILRNVLRSLVTESARKKKEDNHES